MKTVVLVSLLLPIASGLAALFYPIDHRFEFDFVQYWGSLRVLAQNQNPYDPMALLEAQKVVRPELDTPIMMWNPPWVILLTYPVLALPYEVSLIAWNVMSVLVYCVAVALLLPVYHGDRRHSLPLIAVSVSFFPLWVSLGFGQSSSLLLLGAVLLMRGISEQNVLILAAGSILAAVKPHLFLFFGVVAAYDIARKGSFKLFLAPLYSLALVMALSELIFPGVISWWAAAIHTPPEGAIAPFRWSVTTLVGVVRGLTATADGMLAVWPVVVIPTVAMVGYAISASLFKVKAKFPNDASGVLALSYLVSPYGWVYDAVLLLPAFMEILLRAATLTPRWSAVGIAGAAVGLQFFCYLLLWMPNLELHQGSLWWYPILIFSLWMITRFLSPELPRILSTNSSPQAVEKS